jgi:hypothetical protein
VSTKLAGVATDNKWDCIKGWGLALGELAGGDAAAGFNQRDAPTASVSCLAAQPPVAPEPTTTASYLSPTLLICMFVQSYS